MTFRPSRAPVMALLAVIVASLTACAHDPAPSLAAVPVPERWQAPQPHNGSVTDLTQWWSRFDDPLLAELVAAAQAASPTLATAASRIEQSRATRVAAGAALLPSLDAGANAVRGRPDLATPPVTSLGANLQAAWEIDLFGANRAGRNAAQARLEGAQANWHVARVSLAAEVATAYVGLRACEAQVAQAEADAASRAETARLTELATRAGFQSPAAAALSRASASQGNSQLIAQRAQCDVALKGLVALTALDEPGLRTRLAPRRAALPAPAEITVPSVPGTVLNQRPDLQAAAREVVATSADVDQARARRLPRLTLGGSIGASRIQTGGEHYNGGVWSIGPLALTLPVFDAGTRAANVDAARARYDAAAATYRGQLLQAVREVEEALVRLDSSAARAADTQIALDGFQASLRATEALQRSGLASLFDLEDARRAAVQARVAAIDLQRERVTAWIGLYRALGGDWSATSAAAR